jgi:hypothetical protein
MKRLTIHTAAALLLALLLASPAAAQDRHGLSFLGGAAYERGGPGPSLVASLDRAGFGDTRLEADGPYEHPLYVYAGLELSGFVGGRYRFRNPFSIDFVISNGSRGHAEGYRSYGQTTLFLFWTSIRLTSTVGVHVGPVRLAAGPTMNTVFWDAEINSVSIDGFTRVVVGGTGTVSVNIPGDGVLFSLVAGARAFPAMSLRPELEEPISAHYGTLFLGITLAPQ